MNELLPIMSYESRKRLRVLADFLREEPLRFQMSHWMRVEVDKGSRFNSVNHHGPSCNRPSCHTTGCISGWSQHLFLEAYPVDIADIDKYNVEGQVAAGCRALLLPEGSPIAELLFFVDHWPNQYRYFHETLNRDLQTAQHDPDTNLDFRYIAKKLVENFDNRLNWLFEFETRVEED